MCNILMGLFSPYKFGLKEYLGYDITKFKDHIRFLEILVNRDAEMGGIIALFFDGATCTFIELPKPDDTEGLNKVYKYLETFNKPSGKVFFLHSINKTFNTIKNKFNINKTKR